MGSKAIETVMGAVVLIVAATFLVFAWDKAHMDAPRGYVLSAAFNSVGGIEIGSDVRVNGIKVGTVTGQRLDPETFQAVVDLSIDPQLKVPTNSTAGIASDGMLGGKHIRLEPGNAKEYLPAGGRIAATRDYRSLEELVGEIIFLATGQTGGAQ